MSVRLREVVVRLFLCIAGVSVSLRCGRGTDGGFFLLCCSTEETDFEKLLHCLFCCSSLWVPLFYVIFDELRRT